MISKNVIGISVFVALLVATSINAKAQKIKWVDGKMVLIGEEKAGDGCKLPTIKDVDSNTTKKCK